MATAPKSSSALVQGILRASPPSASRSRVPVPWSTLPAQRKSSPFIKAWLQRWKPAANAPSAATSGEPIAVPQKAIPSPTRMRPMFSTLE